MKVEFGFCDIDEITLGLFLAYGEDEIGEFHMMTFGFAFCYINFIRY